MIQIFLKLVKLTKSLRNYKDLVKEKTVQNDRRAPPDIKISLGDLRNHFRYQKLY